MEFSTWSRKGDTLLFYLIKKFQDCPEMNSRIWDLINIILDVGKTKDKKFLCLSRGWDIGRNEAIAQGDQLIKILLEKPECIVRNSSRHLALEKLLHFKLYMLNSVDFGTGIERAVQKHFEFIFGTGDESLGGKLNNLEVNKSEIQDILQPFRTEDRMREFCLEYTGVFRLFEEETDRFSDRKYHILNEFIMSVHKVNSSVSEMMIYTAYRNLLHGDYFIFSRLFLFFESDTWYRFFNKPEHYRAFLKFLNDYYLHSSAWFLPNAIQKFFATRADMDTGIRMRYGNFLIQIF